MKKEEVQKRINEFDNDMDIVVGLMILDFSRQDFLKNIKYKNEKTNKMKVMSEEEKFETLVSLLAIGVLYIVMLDDGNLTFRNRDKNKPEEWCPIERFTEVYKGKYEALCVIDKDMKETIEREENAEAKEK